MYKTERRGAIPRDTTTELSSKNSTDRLGKEIQGERIYTFR